jgi:hypothetical protein
MGIIEKGPGDVKGYAEGSVRKLKLQSDGNPFPYERTFNADGGIQDDEKASSFQAEPSYKPKVNDNEGDNGSGGSGK